MAAGRWGWAGLGFALLPGPSRSLASGNASRADKEMAGRGFFPSVKGEFGKAERGGTLEDKGNNSVPPYWSSPRGKQHEGREGGPRAACGRRRLRSSALAQEGLPEASSPRPCA